MHPRAPLKTRAEEIGLPDSLRALIEHSDETFARQINYILEQIEKAAQVKLRSPSHAFSRLLTPSLR